MPPAGRYRGSQGGIVTRRGENIYGAGWRVVPAHPAVRETIGYALPDGHLGERLAVEVAMTPT